MNNKPLVTVVTVTYNAGSVLEDTILSVLNQTYPNIEYIIIDGGSTDETIDIIKKYEDRISYWVSEPDDGIYDAMNKGIEKATGDWINFMNAGDMFYSRNVLADIFIDRLSEVNNQDVLYGDTVFKYYSYSFMEKPAPIDTLEDNKYFSHQSSFAKVELMKKYKFNPNLKISSDYQFFYELYKNGYNFLYTPIIISIFLGENSTSGTHKMQAYKETAIINHKYDKKTWFLTYLKFCIRIKLASIYRNFISEDKILKIRKTRLLGNDRIKWIKLE